MSSRKTRSDDASTGTIMTTEMTSIIIALSAGGLMTKREVVGSPEGTTRKTNTTGEATMTTVDAQIPRHIPDRQLHPATGGHCLHMIDEEADLPLLTTAAEDHHLRTACEEAGLPLPTTATTLDLHHAGKQTATASITVKASPLIALRTAATHPPQNHNQDKRSKMRLWTSLLD